MTADTQDMSGPILGRAGGSSTSIPTRQRPRTMGREEIRLPCAKSRPRTGSSASCAPAWTASAVTDHNSGEWIDRLKSALSNLEEEEHDDFRPLYLFPGVEVTANGNIHVLAVFDTDKESSDIDKLLGDVGYRGGPGESARAAEEAPIGVVEAICKAGAVPVLAHVDGPSGAWQLSGNTLGPLLDASGLFAIEVVDRESERPALYLQRRFSWAEVLGSDSHHPAGGTGDRFPGSHYTWVKMANPSLEGLRTGVVGRTRIFHPAQRFARTFQSIFVAHSPYRINRDR